MMLIDEIKKREPIGSGRWHVKNYLRTESYWQIYSVVDNIGKSAEMRTVLLPTDEMVNDYEGMYGSSEHTNDLIISDLERQLDTLLGIIKKVQLMSADNGNILSIYDYGNFISENGYCFYVITEEAELIDSYLSKTAVNKGMALKIGSDTAAALSICENNSIVHGYVDNNNIFYGGDGTYKLGNFGMDELFKNIRLKQEFPPEYCAAPEAVTNKDYSSVGDIYSLGMVMYKLFNFNRLPFLPSKDKNYFVSSYMTDEAYHRRLSGQALPPPAYADEALSGIICKCCSFNKQDRYQTASELKSDLDKLVSTEDLSKILEYPNFSAFGTHKHSGDETRSSDSEQEIKKHDTARDYGNFSSNYFSNTESSSEASSLAEKEDVNSYTMGAQAYYTDALGSIANNRHTEINDDELSNIKEVSQKIADKYGTESKEFRKFTEKLQTLEDIREDNEILQEENKKRANIIKILCGAALAAIILGVVFLMNSTTYYINQGQFNRIYKRTLFGSVECFKEVPAENLEKYKNNLYYINSGDRKIYRTSTKNGMDEEVIGSGTASMFKIEDGYIYYINSGDGNKLYRTSLKDGTSECVYDKGCIGISEKKGDIELIAAENPNEPMILDTKSLSVTEALIE